MNNHAHILINTEEIEELSKYMLKNEYNVSLRKIAEELHTGREKIRKIWSE